MPEPIVTQTILAELPTLCAPFGRGRWAIAVGGSFGKGTDDATSDLDPRYYADALAMPLGEIAAAINPWVAGWAGRGVKIDGVWVRTTAEVEAPLGRWLAGELAAQEMVWTVWGYHLLPDLYYQRIVLDPFGLAAGWKERLSVYPPALKRAVLAKHGGSLRYWRSDYHYASKVRREDAVFLAGLSARLVHDMCQVIFALNERYFVGDGQNLRFIEAMPIQPRDFSARVEQALYPGAGAGRYQAQYDALRGLIEDVLALAEVNWP